LFKNSIDLQEWKGRRRKRVRCNEGGGRKGGVGQLLVLFYKAGEWGADV
jgi:hypothetical protein